MKKNSILIVLLMAGSLLAAAQSLWADYSDQPASRLKVVLHLKRDSYKAGEPLEGTVEVTNDYPAGLPTIFNITLFHEDIAVSNFLTSIQIPPGTTEFTFRQFGIPDFDLEPASAGQWRIVILQQNRDASEAREVAFRILPPSKQ